MSEGTAGHNELVILFGNDELEGMTRMLMSLLLAL